MRDSLREAPVSPGRPSRHSPSCGRKGGALADAEQKAREKQRNDAAGGAHPCRGGAHDESAKRQRQARPQSVADRAAEGLQQGKRIPNAPNTRPSWPLLRPRSAAITGPAIARLVRLTK